MPDVFHVQMQGGHEDSNCLRALVVEELHNLENTVFLFLFSMSTTLPGETEHHFEVNVLPSPTHSSDCRILITSRWKFLCTHQQPYNIWTSSKARNWAFKAHGLCYTIQSVTLVVKFNQTLRQTLQIVFRWWR